MKGRKNSVGFDLAELIATGRVFSIDGVPVGTTPQAAKAQPKAAVIPGVSPEKPKATPKAATAVKPSGSAPRTAKQAREAKAGPVNPEVAERRSRAIATLVLEGRAVYSTNRYQWKHWSAKHRERNRAAEVIQVGTWQVPFGGTIPSGHDGKRQHLVFVWYGKRLMDRANLANGCKALLDELVARGFLIDDNPHWVLDEYFPELDARERLEILFLGVA